MKFDPNAHARSFEYLNLNYLNAAPLAIAFGAQLLRLFMQPLHYGWSLDAGIDMPNGYRKQLSISGAEKVAFFRQSRSSFV